MMTKGFGNERAMGVTGITISLMAVLIRMLGLISDTGMYICLIIGVLGIMMLMKESANYEQ